MTIAQQKHAERMRAYTERGAPTLPSAVLAVLSDCAIRFGIPLAALRDSSNHERGPVEARRLACHRLRGIGFSLNQVGRWTGMTHRSVIYALEKNPLTRFPREPVIPGPVQVPDLSGEWAI